MAIAFRTEMDFEYGKVDQLSPLIRRVIANNPSPFTYTGTGTYIIGRGAVAVIDPGPLLYEHIDAILAALDAGEQISHIFITHTHSDHSPAAFPLQEKTGAQIYGFAPQPKAENNDLPAHTVETPAHEVQMEEDADADFTPDIALTHGDIIRGDGWTLETVHTPGHMSNHLCFGLQEEKVLFSGDHVMGWSTSVIIPPDGNMQDYMNSLAILLERDDEIYWPTHGPAIPNPHEFVSDYIAHREMREAQILAQIKNGQSQIREMVNIMYRDVDTRLHPAAALSVFAHIEDLVNRNILVCEGTLSIDKGVYKLKT